MKNKSRFLNKAIEIAKRAGNMLKENQWGNFEVEHKGEIDLVTSMDKKAEKMIVNYLEENFSHHGILAEEGTDIEQESEYTWVIDPLDGTTNYAHKIPWFAVSIALRKNRESIVGVVYHPCNNELFYSEKGEGAYVNDKRLKVTDTSELINSVLVTGFPYYIKSRNKRVFKNFENLVTRTQGLRRFGAASLDLCYVAKGVYDGFWEEGLKPWDTAAGVLFVEEAGGRVTGYNGEKYSIFDNMILATNGNIHPLVTDILIKKDFE
ncbi:MAG: inositol monophosphatase family protein [Vulcanimicrobiota bacterium]